MSDDLIYESTALEILKITRGKFKKLGIEPAKVVKNPRYSSAAPSRLYRRKQIEELATKEEIIAMRPKPRKAKNWDAIFEKKYHDVDNALQDVCAAMFNLNRYAKHRTCTRKNRNEIYDLKGSLVKYLYESSYHFEISKHENLVRARIDKCPNCNGEGVDYRQDYDGPEGWNYECSKCRGQGFIDEIRHEFAVFNFDIEGVTYTWHQPMHLIDYSLEFTTDEPTEMNETFIKPILINRNKFSECKRLIEWYLVSKNQKIHFSHIYEPKRYYDFTRGRR